MAYYPPYPNIYQPGIYQQMGPQSPMIMQNPQQLPGQNQQVQTVQPMPQIPPAQTPGQQNNYMIWINGKAEADSWPVLPGNAVALWDSNSPVVYLRQADSTGKPSTKVYDLVERTDAPAQRPAPQFDPSRYLTTEAAEEMIDRRVNDILTERLKRPSKTVLKKEDTDNG